MSREDTASIMVIAGEHSGDMHAGDLVSALKTREPELEVYGVGGPAMRAAGAETLYDVEDMAVMGFVEVLKHYRFFKRVFNELLEVVRRRRPRAVILVDYPGFNLRFAAQCHKLQITTIYYICPQVWAWHRSRIPEMARILDRLIAIFPFEPPLFEGTGLTVDYVGHPLVSQALATLAEPPAELPFPGTARVALLPGSRAAEITRLLPVMWDTAQRLQCDYTETTFLVAAPTPEVEALLQQEISRLPRGPRDWRIVTGMTRQVLRQSRVALVASGTATLEAAMMNCPMVVTYKVAPLTFALGKLLVRTDHIGMVNIVAGKRICPEYLQDEATAPSLAVALTDIMTDSPARETMLAELAKVRDALGHGGAAAKAAECVLQELETG